MLKLETSSKNPQPKFFFKTLELRTYDWWSSSYQELDCAANASDGIEPKKEDLWGTKNVMSWMCLEWFRNFFFSFMFLQLFSYEDHHQQQQLLLLLLLPIPTNFMSSLCSLFQQSSLLSMSKARTLVSSSSSSSSCYRDCVLLSCIHSKRILFYFWVEICLCRKQIECEQGSN
jgi:hypothetical protein